jgi:hypothetical protein
MATKLKKDMVDIYVTYVLLLKLTTPFTQWNAYKLGIIDKNGNQIREATSKADKDAWGYFDRLSANLKKAIAKLPGGIQTSANFYIACKTLIGGEDPRKIEAELKSYSGQAKSYLANIQEDAMAVNAIGDASSLAGLDNNPPAKKPQKLIKRIKSVIKKRNKF